MGYLICDKCGGYYELQPGEAPDDFSDECECGGELIYLENFEDSSESEITIICSHCGTENPDYASFCQECGKNLNYIIKRNEIKSTKTPNSPKVGINLGNKLIQAKNDIENDLILLKEFKSDLEKIVKKYGSVEVESEEEFLEQMRKIDSEINLKKEFLDKKLKYYNNRIIINKFRDKNKPFLLKYSISLKKGQKIGYERVVFFTDSNGNKNKVKVILREDHIRIGDIDFSSSCLSKSSDGNYVISCRDIYNVLKNGISKINGGEVVFITYNELFLLKDFERPHYCKVAENGNFIITDWLFSQYRGTLYAFNSKRELLIKTKFNSNLAKSGISENGQYAVVETAYNRKSDDQNKIFFYDLNNKKLLWERVRDSGNIKSFKFNENEKILTVCYDNGINYRHSFNGEFLDNEKLEKKRIHRANGYELFRIAEEKMDDLDYKKSNLSDYEEVLTLLMKASNKDVSRHTKAKVNRLIGEIYYNYDKTDEAVKYFEKALSQDPKVGVKRLYDKLNLR